jgi:hypothetical protein
MKEQPLYQPRVAPSPVDLVCEASVGLVMPSNWASADVFRCVRGTYETTEILPKKESKGRVSSVRNECRSSEVPKPATASGEVGGENNAAA